MKDIRPQTSDFRPQKSMSSRVIWTLATGHLLLFTILISLMALTGCDERTTNLAAPRITQFIVLGRETLFENDPAGVDVRAVVKDGNGFPVQDQEVQFKADYDEIKIIWEEDNRTTNINGELKVKIIVDGKIVPANVDSMAVIISACIDFEEQQTISLWLKKQPDVGILLLESPRLHPDVIFNFEMETFIPLTAKPLTLNGNSMPNGTVVTFFSPGRAFRVDISNDPENPVYRIINNQAQVTVNNEYAIAEWYSGRVAGESEIWAEIAGIESDNRYRARVVAGVAVYIELDGSDLPPNDPDNPTSIFVGDANLPIYGTVRDRAGNTCAGRFVTLKSEDANGERMGTITPFATTDSVGVFTAYFSTSNQAGRAIVTAECDSARATMNLTINSFGVSSINFKHTEPITMKVRGTGGNGLDQAVAFVELRDVYGNILQDATYNVRFTIIQAPTLLAGMDPNEDHFTIGTGATVNDVEGEDVNSINGEAYIDMRAGLATGIVALQAEVLDDFKEPMIPRIIARTSNIIVHSGPPHSVSISIPPHGNTEEYSAVGTSNWSMQVSAKLNDVWGNPVSNGVGVMFYIDSFYAQEWDHILYDGAGNPDDAYKVPVNADSLSIISTEQQVGNNNHAGNSVPGHAFTRMIYHGKLANRTVKLRVEVFADPVPFSQTAVFKIPYYNASLVSVANPGYIGFSPTSPPIAIPGHVTISANYPGLTPPPPAGGYVWCEIIVEVKDGQNNPVWNAPVLFTSTRGRFFTHYEFSLTASPLFGNTIPYVDSYPPLAHNEGKTGSDGRLIKRFYEIENLIPPDPMGGLEMIKPVRVNARIFGYPGTEPPPTEFNIITYAPGAFPAPANGTFYLPDEISSMFQQLQGDFRKDN